MRAARWAVRGHRYNASCRRGSFLQTAHNPLGAAMKYSLGERRVECRGDCFIAHNATVIGSVVLENDASVWFNTVVRGDNYTIVIGERSNIQDSSVLHTDEGVPLTIGR